jgi:hypothetical protein
VPEGTYPNCEKPPPCVLRHCLPSAECVERDDGTADCVCRNGGTYPNCIVPNCNPKCSPEAECLIDGDKSTCICKESAGVYPDCKPVCETCEDDNSFCVFRETPKGVERRCACKPGTVGISPNCVPSCDNVLCPPGQKCVRPNGGPGECVCNDPRVRSLYLVPEATSVQYRGLVFRKTYCSPTAYRGEKGNSIREYETSKKQFEPEYRFYLGRSNTVFSTFRSTNSVYSLISHQVPVFELCACYTGTA